MAELNSSWTLALFVFPQTFKDLRGYHSARAAGLHIRTGALSILDGLACILSDYVALLRGPLLQRVVPCINNVACDYRQRPAGTWIIAGVVIESVLTRAVLRIPYARLPETGANGGYLSGSINCGAGRASSCFLRRSSSFLVFSWLLQSATTSLVTGNNSSPVSGSKPIKSKSSTMPFSFL